MTAAITRVLRTASDIRAPVGSTFETAFRAFRAFFKSKTGRAWELRLEVEASKSKGEEGRFVYVPPPVLGGGGVGGGEGGVGTGMGRAPLLGPLAVGVGETKERDREGVGMEGVGVRVVMEGAVELG